MSEMETARIPAEMLRITSPTFLKSFLKIITKKSAGKSNRTHNIIRVKMKVNLINSSVIDEYKRRK
jgi:hypothetical protein